MTPFDPISRRRFFGLSTAGLGAAALGSLAARDLGAQGAPGLPHFAPKAKRLIYLFMNGGASQMDLYDYKPKL
ncbi:MAG TPA: sulfatase, partial [Planctomycetota bacterium]|nr:sulfatase [Planctomycetota bacterium]